MNNIDLSRYKRIVQCFWDPEPRNEDPGSSIWCLGREYAPPSQSAVEAIAANRHNANGTVPIAPESQSSVEPQLSPSGAKSSLKESLIPKATASNEGADHGWPDAFLDDFESKIWLTYRSNFPIIPKSDDPNAPLSMTLGVRLRSQLVDSQGFTSDTGWGCMIRSGQSLLANALSILWLGRDWRRGDRAEEESRLLSLFADHPEAPFSIHRFVKHGASSCGKYPGEWFGPSATARCIQALSNEYKDAGLNVYITSDSSDVYEDKFRTIAYNESGQMNPTLILLGTRLGIDRVTPVYWESLKDTLKYPQSVGIAGGRPSASHYFIGVQGSYFFYLDPHHTRAALPLHNIGDVYSKEELDSYHTRRLRRLHIKDMDPSMLIGFLIKDEQDWEDWKRRVTSVEGKPIVHISNTELLFGPGQEREGALDEVEALDDDEDESDAIVHPNSSI
ncbi:putative autophagy cysteine endopeptidase Atg4 [Thermoascus aurantiacus ATCC 26904]